MTPRDSFLKMAEDAAYFPDVLVAVITYAFKNADLGPKKV
jgi:hypothetical protein